MTNVWGKCAKKEKKNGRRDSEMAGEADTAAICLQCHDAEVLFYLFLFFSVHAFCPHLLDRTLGQRLTLEPSHKSTQGCQQRTGDNIEHR